MGWNLKNGRLRERGMGSLTLSQWEEERVDGNRICDGCGRN